MLWGVAAQVPYMPDELWMMILSYLCGSVCDLVAMSAVNRQLRPLARRQETTDERPIFTEQEGVREVWRQVRFGMRTSRMGCVRTVATGHTWKIWRVVEVLLVAIRVDGVLPTVAELKSSEVLEASAAKASLR